MKTLSPLQNIAESCALEIALYFLIGQIKSNGNNFINFSRGFINMENTHAIVKKINPFLLNHSKQYSKQSSNENTAKESLFQVSEIEGPIPLQLRSANIDVWNEKHNKSQEQQINPIKYFRRTVHFRPSVESKYHLNKTYQDYQNLEGSIIPKLKNILKKLESPEKQRRNVQKPSNLQNIEEKKREIQSWQPKTIKKNDIVLAQNIAEPKRNSIRIKHSSNQKKSVRLLYNHQDSPMRKVLSRQKGLNACQFADQIPLIRQARKRRTLKNILF